VTRLFSELPEPVRDAVNAYDEARRTAFGAKGEPPMSDANKAAIAPMIMAAVAAYAPLIVEVCAGAAEAQDRAGREWVRDSLWSEILKRAGTNVRAVRVDAARLMVGPPDYPRGL
jgi:hypothetical protein